MQFAVCVIQICIFICKTKLLVFLNLKVHLLIHFHVECREILLGVRIGEIMTLLCIALPKKKYQLLWHLKCIVALHTNSYMNQMYYICSCVYNILEAADLKHVTFRSKSRTPNYYYNQTFLLLLSRTNCFDSTEITISRLKIGQEDT